MKIRFFVSLIKLLQRFFELFKAKKFSLAGDLRYLFHVFDLFILVLLRSLVIKGVWFFRILFCFRGACLFKAFWKILVKNSIHFFIVLVDCSLSGSNVDEVIKAVLNSLFFFTERFHTHKHTHTQHTQKHRSTKTQPSKSTKRYKRTKIKMRLKNI